GAHHQHRLPVPLRDLEEPAEAADAGEHLRPRGAARVRLDPLDERVALVDVDAGIAIREALVRHRARTLNSFGAWGLHESARPQRDRPGVADVEDARAARARAHAGRGSSSAPLVRGNVTLGSRRRRAPERQRLRATPTPWCTLRRMRRLKAWFTRVTAFRIGLLTGFAFAAVHVLELAGRMEVPLLTRLEGALTDLRFAQRTALR